jgi:hypothetical protein
MKKIGTETLLRIHIICSTCVLLVLLGISAYLLVTLRNVKTELNTVNFNAMQACEYATPNGVTSNCATN